MKLDLQKDSQKIRRFIEKRIRDYPVYENLGPGDDSEPIAMITFGYYFSQDGSFALVFDTRPDAECDGEWTLHMDNDVNMLPFPKWSDAFQEICDGGTVDVKLPSGKSRTLNDADDDVSVAKLFGEMILETVLALRDSSAFNALPLTRKAFFIIEEFDGNWGYAKRNSLRPTARK